MGREDIGGMIADALESLEGRPEESGGRKASLPHAHAILEQYVALCGTAECAEREPSAAVALPIAAPRDAATPPRASPVRSALRKVLARMKR